MKKLKILWITNIVFGRLSELNGTKNINTSGSWLDAALKVFINNKDIEIIVATIGNTKQTKSLNDGNITYCLLPGEALSKYKHTSQENWSTWEEIKNIHKPDLIQLWGTEFSHGYTALQVMHETPAVVYMQGVISQISRYYLSGMSSKELRTSITLRDIIKLDWIKKAQQRYYQQALIEQEIIKRARNVIVENEWCSNQCTAISHDCNVYYSKLSIRQEFFREKWEFENIIPYSIMSNAAGYPIKGLHLLLKALSIVVSRYPQAKLYIPGEQSPLGKTYFEKLKETGYTKLIRNLILDLNLEKNICFLGKLTSEQMAKQMSKANVFVMPSSIENHSSTLIEAMIVGTPSISSYVGGIPEYVRHNENGIIYRFEEYEILAAFIIKIFENPDIATQLSLNAYHDARLSRNDIDLKTQLLSIYNNILSHQD